ncbi:MAG TPA: hypothetical protein DCW46_07970 [Desulfotomaculum sp.]|nr:hypothetical protein [Desulfotomaculum sp.]
MEKRKIYLLVALILAAAITGGVFASTQISATTEVTVSSGNVFDVSATLDGAKYTSNPSWTPFKNTAGSITAGGLYVIDPKDYTGKMLVTIYLNNPKELMGCYSYLNMGLNAYGKTGENWNADAVGDPVYLTLTNGYVSFILDSGTYEITIDEGSWYCINTEDAERSLKPKLYIDVKQA